MDSLRVEVKGKRYYRNEALGGVLSPSVTSVLWRTCSSGYAEWSAKAAAEAVIANLNEKWSKKKLQEYAQGEGERRRNHHGDIGTKVHNLLWEEKRPDLDFESEIEVITALESWNQFRELAQPRLITQELEMVSSTGPLDVLGFGGTLDMVVELPDGRIVLLDVKTSRIINISSAYQVAAYTWAWEQTQAGGPNPHIDELWVLRLGKYSVKIEVAEIDYQAAWKGFYHAHQLYQSLEGGDVWQ